MLEHLSPNADEPAIGDASLGNHRKRHEGQQSERRRKLAPECSRRVLERRVRDCYLRKRSVRENAGDRKRQLGQNLTVGDSGQPTAALGDGGDRQQQVAVVGADRDDVVGVVGDRRCQRALAQPETLHVADADAARGVVTLDADEFQEIPLRRGNGPTVVHLRLDLDQPGRDLAGDDADGNVRRRGIEAQVAQA